MTTFAEACDFVLRLARIMHDRDDMRVLSSTEPATHWTISFGAPPLERRSRILGIFVSVGTVVVEKESGDLYSPHSRMSHGNIKDFPFNRQDWDKVTIADLDELKRQLNQQRRLEKP